LGLVLFNFRIGKDKISSCIAGREYSLQSSADRGGVLVELYCYSVNIDFSYIK